MLGQLNIWGKDKVEVAIQRLKEFEPKEGYYLAFSGGKDSVCIYHLAKMAGVKFEAHYNITTVDPPELVYFIRNEYPDVIRHKAEKTMWKLIEQKGIPTRKARFCCDVLKERGGEGRIVVTGVRWYESARRKNTRAEVEINQRNYKSKKAQKEKQIFLHSDNHEKRRMMEQCQSKQKFVINPIIDWEDHEVWEFIRSHKKYEYTDPVTGEVEIIEIKYCVLYDEGFKRLGCIGCPASSKKQILKEFERWPKFKQKYLKAIQKMLDNPVAERTWKTPEDVMNWWIYGKDVTK